MRVEQCNLIGKVFTVKIKIPPPGGPHIFDVWEPSGSGLRDTVLLIFLLIAKKEENLN
jgi:hypothetical protein